MTYSDPLPPVGGYTPLINLQTRTPHGHRHDTDAAGENSGLRVCFGRAPGDSAGWSA
jgi:hypothetical protein